MALGVAFGDAQSRGRDVERERASVFALAEQRDGDAAGACAHVAEERRRDIL